MKKKFISIIWGYHNQIFSFDPKQNYHMLPIQAMTEEGYTCEIFAINSQVKIEDDPNFIKGVNVIYYKSFIKYFLYIFSNRKNIIYSNSITLKTLIVGMIGQKTIFMPHSYPFGNNFIKKVIILFFYMFFSRVRVNNLEEKNKIDFYKKNLAYICPLSISEDFLNIDKVEKKGGCWIGNLTKIKNPEELILAFKILKSKKIAFKLNIIGEDRYNKGGKNFSDLIKINGLENYIILHGVLNSIDVKKILSESLIYINTSISEGQCLSVYEAALAGNILCLKNIISFPSVFGDNALYFSDHTELAQHIEYILNNSDFFYNKIVNNRKLITENYNYNYIKEEIKKLFLSIN